MPVSTRVRVLLREYTKAAESQLVFGARPVALDGALCFGLRKRAAGSDVIFRLAASGHFGARRSPGAGFAPSGGW